MRRFLIIVFSLWGCGGEEAPVTVTLQIDSVPEIVPFVAAQDGDGPWQVIEGDESLRFEFEVTSEKYGFAAVCVSEFSVFMQVELLTTSDSTETRILCAPPGELLRGTCTVEGISPSASSFVHPNGGQLSPDCVFYTPPGTHDLMARRGDAPRSVVLARGVAAGSGPVDFNFFTSNIVLEARLPDVDGLLDGESLDFDSDLLFDRGGSANLSSLYPSDALLFLPRNAMLGNDTHSVGVSASSGSSGSALPALGRYVTRYQKEVSETSYMLPAVRSVSVAALDGDPGRLRATYEDTEVDWAMFAVDQLIVDGPNPNAGFRSVMATISGSWLSGGSTYELPDLSGLAGWQPFWSFRSDVQSMWSFRYVSSNRGYEGRLLRQTFGPPSADLDGLEFQTTALSGVIDP